MVKHLIICMKTQYDSNTKVYGGKKLTYFTFVKALNNQSGAEELHKGSILGFYWMVISVETNIPMVCAPKFPDVFASQYLKEHILYSSPSTP